MAPDLAFLKSETTAPTVITPTTAKRRQWHWQLHLAPIRRVVFPTSARPSTYGGTQDLVAAAQTAMDEAVDRFASYADSGVPAFGGECAVWWVRSIQPWRDGDPQYMDGSALRLLLLPPEPIPRLWAPTSIRSAPRLSEGATLTLSGVGGAASPDTAGSVRARRQSMRTREVAQHVWGCCPCYWECVRTHWRRAYSFPEGRKYEHGHVRKVLLSGASCPFLERGLSSLLLPGSVSIMGYSRRTDPVHGLQDHHYAALET